MMDFTHLSKRNEGFEKITISVANGANFLALKLNRIEVKKAYGVIYLHLHKASQKCYVGITEQSAWSRWTSGVGYRKNRRFASAIKKYGWQAFESYILAFADTRSDLISAEIKAIAAAGGHKSDHTYNLSPGGDIVAENDQPIIGINLRNGKKLSFKSSADAARKIGLNNADMPRAVVRGERKSVAGWWFCAADVINPDPPKVWGNKLRIESLTAIQGKPIIAINHKTQEERRFKSLNEAAQTLRVNQSAITQILKGDGYSAHNWWFKFENDKKAVVPSVIGTAATRLKRDKAVYAHNLKSHDKIRFRNCTEADEKLKLHKGAAASVASGSRASSGEWFFSYDKDALPPAAVRGKLVSIARSLPIIGTKLLTGENKIFDSAKSASKDLGMSRAAISLVLNGKRKSVMGWIFKHAKKV